jgi:uncharacterized protein with von Willebrand factor type A (vWA) domain
LQKSSIMANRDTLGGIIHTYQQYDPQRFPSPTAPPPDVTGSAMEHLLMYGDMREFTDEELANAIHLDPSQIAGLGPSLQAILQMLRERREKILSTFELRGARKTAAKEFHELAASIKPPKELAGRFGRAVQDEQLRELERLFYAHNKDQSPFAKSLVQLVDRLGSKYQIDQMSGKYEFTGTTSLTVPQALEVGEELETIDRLIKQIEEAAKTAQLAIIDMEALEQFAKPGDLNQLQELRERIEQYVKEIAEQQGIERNSKGQYSVTPKAMRLFQSKLLEQIFSELEAGRTGRHHGDIQGEGSVETQRTKPYEFGDALANLDLTTSLTNALIRDLGARPIRFKSEDLVVHHTRNTPKCATAVLMDMSGSMRYGGTYINVKRMALALEGLIRRDYPGDYLQFVEMATFAKAKTSGEVASLLPKPVTIFDPVVRLRADMSDPDISESQIPPHFTNIQHALRLSRMFLTRQDTPNKQIILITDGLPTAHFEDQTLFMLYPPHPRTEQATMREGLLCKQAGITINIFLLSSWSQSSEDIRFAYKLAESTTGRVFFTAGKELDRYVVWDYVQRRRSIIS